jgi:uncharacterized protein YpmB
MRKIFILFLILLFVNSALALSPNEAVTFVTRTNNFLLDNEQGAIVSPQVTINYDGDEYYVVAGLTSQDNIGVYIPVSENLEISEGAIEIRELISTEIVLDNVFELKNSYPASDWPFSHPVKTKFYDLSNSLNNLSPSIANVINDLSGIEGAEELEDLAIEVKDKVDNLSVESEELAILIEEGISFEAEFLSDPDTNQRKDYEDLFENYFEEVDDYKSNYNALEADIDFLRQGIGSFQGNIESSQKEFYLSVMRLPNETASLPSFFTLNETTKTFVEQIFQNSKNIENYVSNLTTRKNRNEAWKVIYANNEDITKLNNNFSNLDEATTAILSEDNVDFWKEQNEVRALRTNYRQAVENYENGIYSKAISFGDDAKDNVELILESGAIEVEDNSSELITQIIIALIIILVVVFLAEKYYFNKKEEINDMYEEEFYEN